MTRHCDTCLKPSGKPHMIWIHLVDNYGYLRSFTANGGQDRGVSGRNINSEL